MSFLNSLIKDPKYQTNDPRQSDEIGDPEIIISPDTRREQRIPPGQSRTKKWPLLDNVWTGVSTREIARLAGVKPEAKFVLALAYDYGWTTNVPIEYFLKEDSLFAFLHDGAPIPPEHGGPVRLIIPQLYAWKSAKWVKGVRFLAEDQPGFWEEGGYHMRGNPWTSGDGERFRWS